MTDRWNPVQGGPSSLQFTVQDLYSSAAVCVINRGTAPQRVSVTVSCRSGTSAQEASEAVQQFSVLCDPSTSGRLTSSSISSVSSSVFSSSSPTALSSANSLVPPDTTVVAAVISPQGQTRQLPQGLLVQVYSASAMTADGNNNNNAVAAATGGVASTTLLEAETSSREIDAWLKRRRNVHDGDSPSPSSTAS